MPLLAACLRFAERVDRCVTGDEVILALDDTVRPIVRCFGLWQISSLTQRGNRDPYRVYTHPDVTPFVREYWPKFKQHGPSFIARYAWRSRRDVSLRDVLRSEKPEPDELWICELMQRHGMGDIRYIPALQWWFAVFWSHRHIRLGKRDALALRIASELAAKHIETLDHWSCFDPRLTARERDVLRLLKDDRSERQVAQLLKIELSSVKKYVARAKRKLGTTALRETIAEAVRHYVVLGMVATLAVQRVIAELDLEPPFPF